MKPLQKSIPQKHGLQSLGKVPTARRAPANLPSLKAEHSGNDPTINLVPSGHGGVGGSWTAGSKEENELQNTNSKPDGGHANSTNPPTSNSLQSSLSSKSTWGSSNSTAAASSSSTTNSITSNNNTSKPIKTNKPKAGPVLSQRSPLFGQDFPSLTAAALEGSPPTTGAESSEASPPPSSKTEPKYGPGPSLRPQSFPSWSFSGKQQSPQGSEKESSNDKGNNHSFEGRSRNLPESTNLKFDVGVNSPLLQQQQHEKQQSGTSSYSAGSGRKTSAPQRSQAVLVNKPSHQPQNRPRENLFQGSIIDNEKLKRMDDIDCSTDDDWARKDESFDYNKKIDRYYFFYFLTLFKILF